MKCANHPSTLEPLPKNPTGQSSLLIVRKKACQDIPEGIKKRKYTHEQLQKVADLYQRDLRDYFYHGAQLAPVPLEAEDVQESLKFDSDEHSDFSPKLNCFDVWKQEEQEEALEEKKKEELL